LDLLEPSSSSEAEESHWYCSLLQFLELYRKRDVRLLKKSGKSVRNTSKKKNESKDLKVRFRFLSSQLFACGVFFFAWGFFGVFCFYYYLYSGSPTHLWQFQLLYLCFSEDEGFCTKTKPTSASVTFFARICGTSNSALQICHNPISVRKSKFDFWNYFNRSMEVSLRFSFARGQNLDQLKEVVCVQTRRVCVPPEQEEETPKVQEEQHKATVSKLSWGRSKVLLQLRTLH